MDKIKVKLRNTPRKTGVYLFKNKIGSVIYIGKALNLKSRVNQYFDGHDTRPQIPFLVNDVADFDYIITDNELESLMLENTLIKKHQPKYNVLLRDDKNYAFIKIDYDTEIPQIYSVRNPDSKNAKYFGPYSSAGKIKETLNILRRVFPYCANKKVSNRPCFYYFLHRCPGVCVGKISLSEYEKTIQKIVLFLGGHISEIQKEIQSQMIKSSKNKQFERAADLRNQLQSLHIIEERQKVIFTQRVSWDFVSCFQSTDKATINVFVIRNGKLNDRKNFILENTENKTEEEIFSAFLENYYSQTTYLPKEIFVQQLPKELSALTKVMTLNSGRRIKIIKPRIGKKSEIIKMGAENAREYFESWATSQATELSRTTLALDELKKVLKLSETPKRIECFDISNIKGTNSVASMVVFEDGKAKKSEYRKFKIKKDGKPNDFAMMEEALTRRFKNNGENQWTLPNLLVIDGGKGQLGVAVKVLKKSNLKIPVIGLAKREEEIFIPGRSKPILLSKSNHSLQLLQRLRDEAHRFAITFHKKLRSKQAYKSVLDDIMGIGPKKKKLLIQRFGSVGGVKKASADELISILGEKTAKDLLENL
ncbi:MAG: excinuclease ABC subunit UvrC [Candidatus Doudnabacteria bacterium]